MRMTESQTCFLQVALSLSSITKNTMAKSYSYHKKKRLQTEKKEIPRRLLTTKIKFKLREKLILKICFLSDKKTMAIK